MANRPLFTPSENGQLPQTHNLDFTWHAGMAASQKQKSIRELHAVAVETGVCTRPLEISSKSEVALGVALSAFNLQVPLANNRHTYVENVFQAAKVFERGGPFIDLLQVSPLEAKRDIRLKEHGNLISFHSRGGVSWPLEPKTLFYDWVYLNALHRNTELSDAVMAYDGFTDIEFNPKKSINCQAKSVALYVELRRSQLIEIVLASAEAFQTHIKGAVPEKPSDINNALQPSLL